MCTESGSPFGLICSLSGKLAPKESWSLVYGFMSANMPLGGSVSLGAKKRQVKSG